MKTHGTGLEAEGSLADWLRGQDGAEDPAPAPFLEDPGNGPPRRRLLALAALPWALALALALLAITRATPPDAPPPEPATSAPPIAVATSAPDGPPAPDAPPLAVATPVPGAPPPVDVPVPDERSGEVGALLVRAALSAPGDDGTAARYVDEAVATQVETVGDTAVVTVLAVLLEGGERGWERASLARYGVAVRAGGAVAGPWLLPAPAPPPDPGAPVEDPALHEHATAALAAAGYGDVTAVQLTRHPALPGVLRAAFLASAPGSATPTDQTALLRDAPEPLLLGTRPDPNTPT